MERITRSLSRSALLLAALVLGITALGGALLVASPDVAHAQQSPLIYSEVYDAASTVDAAGITNPIPAPGAVLGDFCIASVGVDVVDMTITCNIQAAGVAEVRMQNESGSTADLASTTWRVIVFPRGTR